MTSWDSVRTRPEFFQPDLVRDVVELLAADDIHVAQKPFALRADERRHLCCAHAPGLGHPLILVPADRVPTVRKTGRI